MRSTLIKNATIVSMDSAIGDLDGGDILIDGEKIVAVGRHIEAGDATVIDGRGYIAIPGLVNAHIHTWEFALRGIGGNWVGSRDYHANMHQGMATRYNARDVYLANLLGSLNQIHHGTTTIMDWCHIVKDAEMTDAAQREFPRVDMRVDEPRDRDVSAAVDHGRIAGFDITADGDDFFAVDQNVAAVEIADGGIHRHDG